jgi:hypothetical protein
MPWIYHQRTGRLEHDGVSVASGYSGAPGAVNNPDREFEFLIGPIPRGNYTIGALQLNGGHMGQNVIPLTPIGHNGHGRSGFFIHGDSIRRPGTASQGCIVLPLDVRTRINSSRDRVLQVVQ